MGIENCVLCGKAMYEFGNNPYPLKGHGRCCDICNITKVVPARLDAIQRRGIPSFYGFHSGSIPVVA